METGARERERKRIREGQIQTGKRRQRGQEERKIETGRRK